VLCVSVCVGCGFVECVGLGVRVAVRVKFCVWCMGVGVVVFPGVAVGVWVLVWWCGYMCGCGGFILEVCEFVRAVVFVSLSTSVCVCVSVC